MNLKRFVLQHLAHLAFGAAAIVIVVLGGSLYAAAVESKDSTRRVAHTLEIIQGIHGVNEQLGRAESA